MKMTMGFPLSVHGSTAGTDHGDFNAGQAQEQFVNSQLAYVSVSRGSYDAQIYTEMMGDWVKH